MAELLAPFAAPLRVVHALTGILLVAGLLGRWVALAQAEQATRAADLSSVRALLRASSVFERIVIPSSIAVLALGLLTAWSHGYPLLGSLQDGRDNWLPVSLLLYLSTFLLVPTIFLPEGRRFGAALDEAIARDQITPTLVAAFSNPHVRAGPRLRGRGGGRGAGTDAFAAVLATLASAGEDRSRHLPGHVRVRAVVPFSTG